MVEVHVVAEPTGKENEEPIPASATGSSEDSAVVSSIDTEPPKIIVSTAETVEHNIISETVSDSIAPADHQQKDAEMEVTLINATESSVGTNEVNVTDDEDIGSAPLATVESGELEIAAAETTELCEQSQQVEDVELYIEESDSNPDLTSSDDVEQEITVLENAAQEDTIQADSVTIQEHAAPVVESPGDIESPIPSVDEADMNVEPEGLTSEADKTDSRDSANECTPPIIVEPLSESLDDSGPKLDTNGLGAEATDAADMVDNADSKPLLVDTELSPEIKAEVSDELQAELSDSDLLSLTEDIAKSQAADVQDVVPSDSIAEQSNIETSEDCKDLPKSECGSTPDEAELNPAISVEKFNSPEHETADEKQAEMELEPHIAVSPSPDALSETTEMTMPAEGQSDVGTEAPRDAEEVVVYDNDTQSPVSSTLDPEHILEPAELGNETEYQPDKQESAKEVQDVLSIQDIKINPDNHVLLVTAPAASIDEAESQDLQETSEAEEVPNPEPSTNLENESATEASTVDEKPAPEDVVSESVDANPEERVLLAGESRNEDCSEKETTETQPPDESLENPIEPQQDDETPQADIASSLEKAHVEQTTPQTNAEVDAHITAKPTTQGDNADSAKNSTEQEV